MDVGFSVIGNLNLELALCFPNFLCILVYTICFPNTSPTSTRERITAYNHIGIFKSMSQWNDYIAISIRNSLMILVNKKSFITIERIGDRLCLWHKLLLWNRPGVEILRRWMFRVRIKNTSNWAVRFYSM